MSRENWVYRMGVCNSDILLFNCIVDSCLIVDFSLIQIVHYTFITGYHWSDHLSLLMCVILSAEMTINNIILWVVLDLCD